MHTKHNKAEVYHLVPRASTSGPSCCPNLLKKKQTQRRVRGRHGGDSQGTFKVRFLRRFLSYLSNLNLPYNKALQCGVMRPGHKVCCFCAQSDTPISVVIYIELAGQISRHVLSPLALVQNRSKVNIWGTSGGAGGGAI